MGNNDYMEIIKGRIKLYDRYIDYNRSKKS